MKTGATLAENIYRFLNSRRLPQESGHSRFKLGALHPFPAPMSPNLTESIIENVTSEDSVILDPMAGSGTVLHIAKYLGRKAFGVDIDPLARLMVRAAVSGCDIKRVRCVGKTVLRKARVQCWKPAHLDDMFEVKFDSETQEFIRFWFPAKIRRKLLALWYVIENVSQSEIRDVLALAFSKTIIAKTAGTSYAIDLPHTRPHRKLNKQIPDPFVMFDKRLEEVARKLERVSGGSSKNRIMIREGDARSLPFRTKSIDFVLTSSPYANAIDYVRAHKFSLVWMGYSIAELRELRGRMIGAERGEYCIKKRLGWLEDVLPNPRNMRARKRAILRKYYYDLDQVIAEIQRVLKPGGGCIMVLGRSVIEDNVVNTPAIVTKLASARGLDYLGTKYREINPNRRSLPFPQAHDDSGPLGKRMAQEAIVGFGR